MSAFVSNLDNHVEVSGAERASLRANQNGDVNKEKPVGVDEGAGQTREKRA